MWVVLRKSGDPRVGQGLIHGRKRFNFAGLDGCSPLVEISTLTVTMVARGCTFPLGGILIDAARPRPKRLCTHVAKFHEVAFASFEPVEHTQRGRKQTRTFYRSTACGAWKKGIPVKGAGSNGCCM